MSELWEGYEGVMGRVAGQVLGSGINLMDTLIPVSKCG